MNATHTAALTELFERNANSWRASNREEDVVTTARIGNHTVSARTLYVDGRTMWKLDGKRAAFSAIHNTMRQLDAA